jgi:hypothetical protein
MAMMKAVVILEPGGLHLGSGDARVFGVRSIEVAPHAFKPHYPA